MNINFFAHVIRWHKTMFSILFSAVSFFTPSARLANGEKISLIGKGAPVVFSTGLFDTMPHNIYSDFVSKLKKHMTVVVREQWSPMDRSTLKMISDALAVDQVGLIAHSSFDPAIIDEHACKVFLMDPIAFPSWAPGRGFTQSVTKGDIDAPIQVAHAALAYDGETPIPDYLEPEIADSKSPILLYKNVGHVDILDDTWADIGTRMPWVPGASPTKTNFTFWQSSNVRGERAVRNSYRKTLADDIVTFFTSDTTPGTATLVAPSPPSPNEKRTIVVDV